jgi:hypothetical protein
MKKTRWLLAFSFTLLSPALLLSSSEKSHNTPQPTFAPGEQLRYRLHYGFITAGEATLYVDPQISYFKSKPVYKVNVEGKSTGTFDVFLRIRNTYLSYIDTSEQVPLYFYRNIEEGNYKRKEYTFFDHATGVATVEIEDPGKDKRVKTFAVKPNVQDMISGYYHIRNMDFNTLLPGALIRVDAFFEDKQYDFQVKYLGKERIKTEIGKVNAIKLTPVMPDNSLFEGGESIKIWISDDANRIPLKVKAEMFVGAVEVDILSFGGLKHPFTARVGK